MSIAQKEAGPWYREPWLWFILSPLIVVVLVSSVTVTLALKYADDTVIDNYYKEGRMINQSLGQDQRARQWGLSADVNWQAAAQQLTVSLDSGQIPMPASLSLWLDHPFDETQDVFLVLERHGENQFSATLASLDSIWYVTLTPEQDRAERSAAPWRLRTEVNFIQHPNVTLTPPVQ
ncbi:FixH family protein [Gilvimarinus polysaccharolyticus]|uniref:FixH family protein n=1 Tax=Gilvimarinus polysaccharolyticus TaxID=863921 RepID=UPI00067365FC|nr:FixH family protein [Gilvimarinus polysaccharolyticus]